MKRKRITTCIALTLTVLVISSCHSAQLALGEYYNKGHSLILNPDSTFYYEYMGGWIGKRSYTNGKWIKKGNQLLLDGRDTLMQGPFPSKMDESHSPALGDTICFVFKPHICSDLRFADYINWFLIIDGAQYPFGNKPFIKIKAVPAGQHFYLEADRDKCIVPALNRDIVQTKTYTLSNKHANIITLSIPLSDKEIYRYASYELIYDTLLIKEGKLVWPRKKLVLKFVEQK